MDDRPVIVVANILITLGVFVGIGIMARVAVL